MTLTDFDASLVIDGFPGPLFHPAGNPMRSDRLSDWGWAGRCFQHVIL